MNKLFTLLALIIVLTILQPKEVYAFGCSSNTCTSCCPRYIEGCQDFCIGVSNDETETTIEHITTELENQRRWMVDTFFDDDTAGDSVGLLAAMRLMSRQFITNGVQQVQIIGSFFDAKHQLETQRELQVLKAEVHKDYQPSKNMCNVGTMFKKLGKTSRKTDVVHTALSRQLIDRQLLAQGSTASHGADSDQKTRLTNYIKRFCNPNDNSKNLDLLCQNSDGIQLLYNRDISYAKSIGMANTLELNFDDNTTSLDEEAIFTFSNNLLSNDVYSFIPQTALVDENDEPAYERGAKDYLKSRAPIAQRSAAVNSLSAIAALKAEGDDTTPFIFSLIRSMGGENADSEFTIEEIQKLIGEKPSYYAQMKVLSKYLYQRPEFYVELYDKPANVKRMDVAVQAATLMRKRDLYRSYLRSEMTLAVMLELEVQKEIDLIANNISGVE